MTVRGAHSLISRVSDCIRTSDQVLVKHSVSAIVLLISCDEVRQLIL